MRVREKFPATSLREMFALEQNEVFNTQWARYRETHGFCQSGPLPLQESGASYIKRKHLWLDLEQWQKYLIQREGLHDTCY